MSKARQLGACGTPAWNEAVEAYIKMMAPVAPHISEELWHLIGKPYSIHSQAWPIFDAAAVAAEEITLVVQVNGKVRDRLVVPVDISEADARSLAMASDIVVKNLGGKPVRQVIYVPGRLINIVV
jgi:leucyl-tRNA synthetase